MNISGLKPFRDYSEHDVINMFTTTGVLQKGTLVAVSAGVGNTNVFQNTGAGAATPYQTVSTSFGSAPNYAYSTSAAVAWTVKAATSSASVVTGVSSGGDTCIGMLLYEVANTNRFGENYRYRPKAERDEYQITIVGEAVPIVKRGTFHTNNISGTAAVGSGFYALAGQFRVQAYNKATSLGTFLTSADADGYALVALDCV